MSEERPGGFWDRVEPGHSTALVGINGRIPAGPRGRWVVRARCDGPFRPLGPVLEAADRVNQLVGAPPIEVAAGKLRRGIRRHLLGEDPAPERDAELLTALDRLADAGAGQAALVFEAVDAADAATLSLLHRLVRQPLRPALVLGFRKEPSGGPARELLDAVLAVEGEGRVIRAPASTEAVERSFDPGSVSAPARAVLRAASVVGDGFEAGLVARLLGLSEVEVLSRLQDAFDDGAPIDDLGDGRFRLEASAAEALRAGVLPSLAAAWHRRLADLLSESPEPELRPEGSDLHLRTPPEAPAAPPAPPTAPAEDDAPPPLFADAPRPTEAPQPEVSAPDDGGLLHMPASLAEALPPEPAEEDPFAQLAPPAPPPAEEPAPPPRGTRLQRLRAPVDPADEADPFSLLATEPEPLPPVEPAPAPPPVQLDGGADPFSALAPPGEPVAPAAAPTQAAAPDDEPFRAPDPEPSPGPAPRRNGGRVVERRQLRPRRPGAVPGRAAQHLAAAGEGEAAIPRFLAAARDAVAEGAYGTAEAYVERALALGSLLPDTATRRELRARAHAELARVHWEGSGPQGFTLAVALQEADTALQLAAEAGSPVLVAEVRGLIAAICYDLGDAEALERALRELTLASRELLAAGEPRAAARLLNDQAAVWVRLGDPVRATHLLTESRRVFADLSAPQPEDRAELAETDHLLARLPLHVAARPGMEQAALTASIARAEEAAQVYQELGDQRELARVRETLGRLERRRGNHRRAAQHLAAAFQTQVQMGDAVGLARSASALAELLAEAGQGDDAVACLAQSIRLNAAKGSPLGLASNREGLTRLIEALPPLERQRLDPQIRALGDALGRALTRMGRVQGDA